MFKTVIAVILLFTATGMYVRAQTKETRNVSGFTEIGFGVAGTLTVKTGTDFSVVIEGDKEYLKDVETVVKNGKLLIRDQNNHFFNNEKVDARITLPELRGLSLSGSGTATIEGKLNADKLYMSVSGSGKIHAAELKSDLLDCSISGSGDIILDGTGSADKGSVSISGSGSYKGEQFEFDHLEVHISGSGNCTCKAGDDLRAFISGSGNVYYYGNPRIDARVSGSGHVRSR